ncbi:DNA-binding GntR family transcriptional regulator [Raoultella sp. BIGb0149]|uniref:GntR family transcriptional regulator n=1 Tax=Raoultella TaxID=160674 RepID=UPI0010CF0C59|nr:MULTISPECIES: FCD domain-containing protein [Raoultella]TDQ27241.1 DNA-binding GntR family transcriptional regulator [Raoultella sp. BIGb0149]
MNEKRTMASRLEERVRRDIINGKLKPGSKMRLKALSEHYDAGVIPLREALSRLATTGFVAAVDQKGFSVRRVSAPELRDITLTRLHIECKALELSILNADIDWESRLIAAHHRMERHDMRDPQSQQLDPAWEEAHEAFHSALLANCGSPWLLHFVDTLCDQTLRYRALAVESPVSQGRDVALEHRQLLQAALDRNIALATSLLTAHYLKTMEIVLENEALG